MVLSVHIPKCGGTSFRLWLEKIYGDRLLYDYSRQWSSAGCNELIPLLYGKHCFHGHINPSTLDGLYESLFKITWIRNPIDRVISYYNHLLRDGDMNNGYFRFVIENKISLLEFAQLDWVKNGISQFLENNPNQFDFIGVVERADLSMHELFSTGIIKRKSRLNDFPCLPKSNTADTSHILFEEYNNINTRKQIAEIHADDMEFYQETLSKIINK